MSTGCYAICWQIELQFKKKKRFHPKIARTYMISNVAGYKNNAQKSVPFLYTSNETWERENKELIPFTIAPKSIRYLGINLTKEVRIYTLKTTERF